MGTQAMPHGYGRGNNVAMVTPNRGSISTTRFGVILADPPWSYQNSGVNGSAAGQYPTMETSAICDLPISELALPDAVLLLWATWPCLTDALQVAVAWGFRCKTGLPWIKIKDCHKDLWGDWRAKSSYGIGWWVIGVSEPILICTRGKAKPPEARFVGLLAENVRHSRKPDDIYEYAEALPGPYLELFARRRREGWAGWGNEGIADIELRKQNTGGHRQVPAKGDHE